MTTTIEKPAAGPETSDDDFKPQPWWAIIWSSKKARVGLIIVGLFCLPAIFAGWIATYDPLDATAEPLLPVSWEHPFGTTPQGYDILSQWIHGTRLSLLVGILGGAFASVIAVVVGLISGYAEGTIVDHVLSFVTNLGMTVPVIPVMLVLVAYSESRGLFLMVFVIGITAWAGPARTKRAQIISLRNRDFVTAAKFSGDRSLRVVFSEIMPNMTSLVVSGFIGAATGAIGAESALSYLGFGDPKVVSWGQMLAIANDSGALAQGFWVWLFVPGFSLAILITALTFINFGVDLISNPHLRED